MPTKKKPARPPARPIVGPGSSRAMVMSILKKQGGEIFDEEGLCTVNLHRMMLKAGWQGSQAGLSSLLRKMEQDGQVTREIPPGTKRCYGISLVEDEEPAPKPVRKVARKTPAKRAPARKKADPAEEQDDLDVTDDEIQTLLPVLVDSIGEERIIDVLLERASRSGLSEEDIQLRVHAVETEWSEKLASATAELEAVRAQQAQAVADGAGLSRQYEATLVELRDVRKELADLQKDSNELLNQATREIGDLKVQLAEAERSRPRRSTGDSAAVIQNIINRREAEKPGRLKG